MNANVKKINLNLEDAPLSVLFYVACKWTKKLSSLFHGH